MIKKGFISLVFIIHILFGQKYDFKFSIPQISITDLSEKKKNGFDENTIHFNLRKPGNIMLFL